MEHGRPLKMVWNGKKYRRYPESPKRHLADYWVRTQNGTRGGARYLHRDIWELHHAMEVPKGYDIHHIDGNSLNNEISNLDLVDRVTHKAEHKKKEWSHLSAFERRLKFARALKLIGPTEYIDETRLKAILSNNAIRNMAAARGKI